MDSKQIYNATRHLKRKLIWLAEDGEEWFYFGNDLSEPYNLIIKQIKADLGSLELYLVVNRTESRKINQSEIMSIINKLAGKENFELWNLELTKALEFNAIEVFRSGILNQQA